MPTIPDLLGELRTSWNDAKALSRAGQELQDRNRFPQAIEALERALELDPSDVDAWAYLAFAHFRAWSPERGEEILRQGIEATGDDSLSAFLHDFTSDDEEKARLAAELEGTTDPAARASLLGGRFYAGEAEGALAELRELVGENPDHPDPKRTLAWLLIGGAGRGIFPAAEVRDEALAVMDELAARDPDRIGGYTLKVQFLSACEDWPAVLAETERVLARFPDDETIMHIRAQAFEKAGDAERAAHWFARAIGAKPSFAGARKDLGKLLEREERFELAEELFREIPRAFPDYPLGPVSLALHLARREKWDEAETLLIEVWSRLPDWAKGMLRNQPDAADLMNRDAVKTAIGEED